MTTAEQERERWNAADPERDVWDHPLIGWKRGVELCVETLEADEDFASFDAAAAVLDLGCGPGRLTVPLAEAHAPTRFVGVDVSVRMVRRAIGMASLAGLTNVDFRECDGRSIPDTGLRFDLAFSVLLFQHLPLPGVFAYLRAVRAALVPDGLFRFQFVEHTAPLETAAHGPYSHAHGKRWMRQACRLAGLEPLRFDRGPDPSWLWLTCRALDAIELQSA